jgi:hypothetical protein
MKTLRIASMLALAAVMALTLVPSEALAAFSPTRILNLYVLSKLLIGNGTESNSIDKSVVADVDYDFANTTIVCNDSWAVTATGASIGDPCDVGG